MRQIRTKIALIPAYEPTDELLNLVVQLSDADFRVVVVDDGSGENYRRIFSAAKRFADVLVHMKNEGKGRALKSGLSFIAHCYPEDSVVVTLDADGQHGMEDAVRVCNEAAFCEGSLVLGSRRFDGKVPARSLLGNTVTRFIYRRVTGVSLSDTQTGLRAFSASLIPFMLSVEGERYEYEMNVLLRCAKERIPIKEVTVSTIYFNNNEGSHFNGLRDSLIICRDIARFAVSPRKDITDCGEAGNILPEPRRISGDTVRYV